MHTRAISGWVRVGPSLLLIVALAAQDAVYRSQPYRRAIAVRHWATARAALAPLAHTHVARRASSWRAPRRWLVYAALFALAVLPEARMAGLLYLGIFVLLLYREQGGVGSLRGGHLI